MLMYMTRNFINNIVITLYGDRQLLGLLWSFHKLLCYIPETDTMLHVSYILIKNYLIKK